MSAAESSLLSLKKSIEDKKNGLSKPAIKFETKLEQAVDMIIDITEAFGQKNILTITDSWFGNNSLWQPLHEKFGGRLHILSRLRSNINIFQLPGTQTKKGARRPGKYGKKLGNASWLAVQFKPPAMQYSVNLYGRNRSVVAHDCVVMLKTLKCPVKVVWIYRKTKWVALFSTDLTLSVEQVIEYYGARWKIEAAFKELKRDIGSAETQSSKSKCRYEPSELLHDGRISSLDLRKSD